MQKVELSMLSTTISGHTFIKEVIESWGDYNIIVMENTLPKEIYKYRLDVDNLKVIVIRDFRNFLASSIKSKVNAYEMSSNFVWSEEYLVPHITAYRAIIEEAIYKEYYDADVVISYDIFCEDQTYRKGICDLLGGTYTEERLGFVPKEGNGSSFDQLSMQGEGQKMKTRDRHEQILETEWAEVYLKLLNENEDLMFKYVTFFEELR